MSGGVAISGVALGGIAVGTVTGGGVAIGDINTGCIGGGVAFDSLAVGGVVDIDDGFANFGGNTVVVGAVPIGGGIVCGVSTSILCVVDPLVYSV